MDSNLKRYLLPVPVGASDLKRYLLLVPDMVDHITTAMNLTLLILAGLDVNRADDEGDTLLHLACDSRRFDIVKILLHM